MYGGIRNGFSFIKDAIPPLSPFDTQQRMRSSLTEKGGA